MTTKSHCFSGYCCLMVFPFYCEKLFYALGKQENIVAETWLNEETFCEKHSWVVYIRTGSWCLKINKIGLWTLSNAVSHVGKRTRNRNRGRELEKVSKLTEKHFLLPGRPILFKLQCFEECMNKKRNIWGNVENLKCFLNNVSSFAKVASVDRDDRYGETI